MQPIPFTKMSGSGNDFVVIDNRRHVVDRTGVELGDFAQRVCRRKLSVGADGMILVEDSPGADFKWRFYNSDGSLAGMCGNGARCVARFAYLNRIAGTQMAFETDAGLIRAKVDSDCVRVKMSPPGNLRPDMAIDSKQGRLNLSAIDTGVPHVVIEVEDIEAVDVAALGREVRYHPDFAPEGTNVNFVKRKASGNAAVRTYERGVEDETLACGTGSVAAALVLAQKYSIPSPIRIQTRSGSRLTIHFSYMGEGKGFEDVYLEGDARIIYTAELGEDAWGKE